MKKYFKFGALVLAFIAIILSFKLYNTSKYNNPKMDDINFSKTNMFILHKDGCRFCEDAQPKMKEAIKTFNNDSYNKKHNYKIYMVEIHTDLGKYLVNHYSIKEPFTAIVTTKQGNAQKFYSEKEVVYKNGKPTDEVNVKGINNLIHKYQKELEK